MSKRHFLGVRITGTVCIYLCEQLKQNYRLFLKGGGLTLVVLPRPPKSLCSREKEKLQSLFLSCVVLPKRHFLRVTANSAPSCLENSLEDAFPLKIQFVDK